MVKFGYPWRGRKAELSKASRLLRHFAGNAVRAIKFAGCESSGRNVIGHGSHPDAQPPPPDNPLFKLDNVRLTSHFAGPTWDNHTARFRNAFDNVQRAGPGNLNRTISGISA
ncbi:MAG: hypothetical protein K2Y27_26235 [Xanthobacteraceae bacterium]|nr:hypothetical protein [Xanthobacteraceae bacterium]